VKFEIEKEDIEAIAQRVSEIIKPMLTHAQGKDEPDTVFDVKAVAQYLKVKESWIYQGVHTNAIPFFKVGKYPRFRKKQIDRWADGKQVRLIPSLKVVKK
jgi:excisionase family DNA binding protein